MIYILKVWLKSYPNNFLYQPDEESIINAWKTFITSPTLSPSPPKRMHNLYYNWPLQINLDPPTKTSPTE